MDWLRERIGLGLPCVFHSLTGLYCPGCGGTRAVRALLKGDLWMSFQYHPLVLYVLFAFLLEMIVRKLTGMEKDLESSNKRIRIYILVGAGIVVVNWIFKNYMLVVRGIDLLPLMD